MTIAELERFLTEHFPGVLDWAKPEHLDKARARVPTLMALADTAMYFLVLANIGPTIHAVTTKPKLTTSGSRMGVRGSCSGSPEIS